MIQITPQMRVLVAVEPAGFRRGIDGLARMCREVLGSDPFSGIASVFRNRRRTALKLFVCDGQGFWLCYKRMSRGRVTRFGRQHAHRYRERTDEGFPGESPYVRRPLEWQGSDRPSRGPWR